MRLAIVETGLSPVQKVFGQIIRLIAGRIPGPVLVSSYKKDLFGKQLSACFQEALRRCTQWTAGEAEIMAAFVSKANRCEY